MNDFQPIASMLGEVFPGLGIRVEKPPVALEILLQLEPTQNYVTRLDALKAGQRARTFLPGMPKDQIYWPGWYRSKIRQTELNLERAQQRDAIQAARPVGCWCLGRGWIRIPRGHDEAWTWEAIQRAGLEKINDYCECPAGDDAWRDHHRRREAFQQGQAQERFERLWASVNIPARYESLTLETLLAKDPGRQGWCDGLRDWEAAAGEVDDYGEVKDWLYLYGEIGMGKTGILCALLKRAVGRGQSAVFVDVPIWLDSLRESFDAESEARESDLMRPLFEVEMLGLDDVGAHQATSWAAGRLRVLINERYKRQKRTVVTSNLEPERLMDEFDQRVGSRLLQASTPVKIGGRNLRD